MFIFLSGAIIMKVVCGNFSRPNSYHLQSFCWCEGVKEFHFNYLPLYIYGFIHGLPFSPTP